MTWTCDNFPLNHLPPEERLLQMSEKKYEKDEELNCEITVNDGAHMTCDMIEEEPLEKEERQPDYTR
jgi:hypothetical protein